MSAEPRPVTPGTPSASSSGTGWPKLARGEIPSTWSKPAEVVSTLPAPAKGRSLAGPLVGMVIALGTAAVVFVLLPQPGQGEQRDVVVAAVPVVPVVPVVPLGVADVGAAIPTPPATSSTTPTAVAPEDQGGDLGSVPALPAASADDPPVESGGITELPARKKAKALTARAIAALRRGDASAAEPTLVRAVLLDPSLADAWRHLGITRAQLGDLDGARRAYRKYLELAPKAPDAAQVRAILAQ